MKTDKIGLNEESDFKDLINSNLEFINEQCYKVIKSKSTELFRGPVDIENERDILFNRILEKLTENDFSLIRRFEWRSKFTTYLTVIIARTSVDMIRKKIGRVGTSGKDKKVVDSEGTPVKEGIYSGEKGDIVVADFMSNPEEKIIEKDIRQKISVIMEKVLLSLTGDERLLLRMRYPHVAEKESVEIRTISKRLGISEKAVYGRLERILKKCRKFLDKSGVNSNDFF